jgi:cytidylate kinase
MAIVTISRQFGSGGDEIANRVCENLGYRQFNKQMIEEAAVEAGITGVEVIDYSEESFKVRSFLDRLFSSIATAEWMGFGPGGEVLLTDVGVAQLDDANALELVKKAILGACRRGNMVIVGRGGQALLQDQPDVLHVRIEAPLENRIQHVKEQLKQTRQVHYADIDLRREAQDLIQSRDTASAEYIKTYYHLDWSDPQLYHVVLNTGKVSVEQAVQVITSLI